MDRGNSVHPPWPQAWQTISGHCPNGLPFLVFNVSRPPGEIADKFLIDGRFMNTTVEAQGQQVDVSQPMNMVLWTIQIGVAGMFFMAGGSKLSGSEQRVQLFQAIGLGPWFRYLTGVMEVGGA